MDLNDEAAFPRLTMAEIAHLKPFATARDSPGLAREGC